MNIIQIQDRLKGMPKEAIIDYIQNPTGEVPTYLALGELQRRKTMEQEYQAMQEPPGSVAEQIVSENMPQGIGSMAPPDMASPTTGVGAPQPAPEMTPDMVAASGIGSLPAENIGQNYAGGGIVAFGEGGWVDKYGEPILEGGLETAGLFAGRLAGPIAGFWPSDLNADENSPEFEAYMAQKMKEAGYAKGGTVKKFGLGGAIANKIVGPGVIDRGIASTIGGAYDFGKKAIPATGNFLWRNRVGAGLGGWGAYELLGGDDEEARKAAEDKLAKDNLEEFRMLQDARLQREAANKTTPVAKEKTMADYAKEFKDMMGTDEYRAKMDERMAKMDEKVAERERKAPWFATMEAGLAIAAGESPYALQNIAAGATRGISSYKDSVEAVQALEEKRLALLDDMAKADRAEKMAAIEYGLNSKQFEATQALKASIANQEATINLMKINIDAQKNYGERAKEVIDAQEMNDWVAAFKESKGSEYDPNSPEFLNAYQAELDRRIKIRSGTAAFDTSGFGKPTKKK